MTIGKNQNKSADIKNNKSLGYIIKEFSNIKVDIKGRGSKDSYYIDNLGIPLNNTSETLAYALASEIEKTNRFIGATIDFYAKGVRGYDESEDKFLFRDQCLHWLIEYFAKKELVYGIVINHKKISKTPRILESASQMKEFFQKEGNWHDSKKVAGTIFVPSEKYTKYIWGFDYKLKDLKRFIDFKQNTN